MTAHGAGDERVLDGTKAWCSGAGLCTRALVTARLSDGKRGLFAVDVRGSAVRPMEHMWRNAGMAESDTRSVQFSSASAIPVGRPGDYFRPGFWFGAIGWRRAGWAVPEPLSRRCTGARRSIRPTTATCPSGRARAAITAAEAALAVVPDQVDADPRNRSGFAELTARRVRATVEKAVDEALMRTIGPSARARSVSTNGTLRRRGSDRLRQAESRRARPCRPGLACGRRPRRWLR